MWPAHITSKFDTTGPGGDYDESTYYSPYNALLNYLFPSEEDFMIIPQFKRPQQAKSIDFTTVFIIERGKKPVFFMEIEPAGHLHQPSSRRYADNQVRERADDFIADGLGIKTVYGVSAIGTRMCLYQLSQETREIEPPAINNQLHRSIDTVPEKWWSLDVLSPEGEKRLREVVAHVKMMCAEHEEAVRYVFSIVVFVH